MTLDVAKTRSVTRCTELVDKRRSRDPGRVGEKTAYIQYWQAWTHSGRSSMKVTMFPSES